MHPDRMIDPSPARRRLWPFLLPAFIGVLLAAGWCGLWFYAADKAEATIAGWLDREARLGRRYDCGSRQIAGFPFRFEVRCRPASAALDTLRIPLAVKLEGAVVAAQVYDPTSLVSDFTGPLTVAGGDQNITVNWRQARTIVRGTPRAPELVSVILEEPTLDRTTETGVERALTGKHIEFDSRVVSGSVFDRPVIGVTLHAVATSAPGFHPLATEPIDADIDTTLYGLKDLAAKPMAVRFREIQEAGGRIEVKSVRVKQGQWLLTGNGTVGLTASGGLDGQLAVTVAGLDQLLQEFGVEYLARSDKSRERVNSAVNVLNQLVPGLGDVARKNAGAGLAAGAALIGEKAELEGRQAVRLPLRFDNGAVYLGPIRVGQIQPLF